MILSSLKRKTIRLLKCPYDHFLHFRVQYDFLTHLAKFQSIMNIRSHSLFTFISDNLRSPLIDLVPKLGCGLEKVALNAQKYLTGGNYKNHKYKT